MTPDLAARVHDWEEGPPAINTLQVADALIRGLMAEVERLRDALEDAEEFTRAYSCDEDEVADWERLRDHMESALGGRDSLRHLTALSTMEDRAAAAESRLARVEQALREAIVLVEECDRRGGHGVTVWPARDRDDLRRLRAALAPPEDQGMVGRVMCALARFLRAE